jgi:hypothetical protein
VEIVWIERQANVVELVVRRAGELARYAFTEVPAPVVPAIENDARFRQDFPRYEDTGARIMMFAVARQAFRGVAVPLPFRLPIGEVRPGGAPRARPRTCGRVLNPIRRNLREDSTGTA